MGPVVVGRAWGAPEASSQTTAKDGSKQPRIARIRILANKRRHHENF